LAPYVADWDRLDGLRDQPVQLALGAERLLGIHRGIAPDGALRLETAEGLRVFHGGEVSLRSVDDTL
jgi:BirA family biotin operon repressor/biotin-[acetyl-CoA-carboxylase] ligase